MRITDLLDARSVSLTSSPKTKSEALDQAVALMTKSGKINDESCRMSRHFASRFMREKKKAPQELEKELPFHMESVMQSADQVWRQWSSKME